MGWGIATREPEALRTPRDETMRHGCALLLLLLGLAAGDAGAQAVYRCAAAQGAAYQEAPCAGLPLQTWARAELVAVPGPRLDREEAQRRIETTREAWQASLNQAESRAASRVRFSRGARSRPAAMRIPRADACARARAARAAAHARRGLHWSFDDASRWDASVFKVCRWG